MAPHQKTMHPGMAGQAKGDQPPLPGDAGPTMMDGERALPFRSTAAGLAVVVVAGQNPGAQTAEVDPVSVALGIAAGAVAGYQFRLQPATSFDSDPQTGHHRAF